VNCQPKYSKGDLEFLRHLITAHTIFQDQPVEVSMNPVTMMLPSTQPEPMLEHAIRQRAYELYVQRGMAHGHAVDDWLKAEGELVHGHSSADSRNQIR
jgi:Protein of unknown function (DUF2934)